MLLPATVGGMWFPKKNLHLALNVLRPQWTTEGLLPDTVGKYTEQCLLLHFDATVISKMKQKDNSQNVYMFPLPPG